MKKALSILLLLPLLMLWQPSAHASDAEFQKGLQAFHSEDYEKAFEIWLTLAEQGHAPSQGAVSIVYGIIGEENPQDFVYAYMWATIAYENGDEKIKEFIDALEEELTSTQRQKAKVLAVECRNANYKDCSD